MRRIKILTIIMTMYLSGYSVMELTRCILKFNAMNEITMLELALMWGFYITIPVILSVAWKTK